MPGNQTLHTESPRQGSLPTWFRESQDPFFPHCSVLVSQFAACPEGPRWDDAEWASGGKENNGQAGMCLGWRQGGSASLLKLRA